MVDTNFPEITVNTTVAGDQTNPRVLQNKDGVVCVIWETTRELVDADGLTQSFSAIQAQLFAIDGSRIGGEIWVTGTEERLLYTDTTINLHRMQLLQRYSDGAFVITWFSSNDLSLSTQILSATGTLIGDVNRIHIETGNAKPTVTARVHLRALTDGGFIAAWSSDDHPTGLTGSSRDVYCARFDDDFVAVGGLAKVFGTLGQVTGDEDVVGLTELSNGGFALAINAQRTPVTNTTSLGVYIATYDSDMTFRGNYHFIPTTSTLNNSITVMRPMYPLATSGFVVIGFSPNGLHAFDDQGILTGTHASPAGHSRTGGFASIASDPGNYTSVNCIRYCQCVCC